MTLAEPGGNGNSAAEPTREASVSGAMTRQPQRRPLCTPAGVRPSAVIRSARAAAALLALLALSRPAMADSDVLWYIVSEQCVPDQQQFHSPKPCALVDLAAGYVVLKDRDGDTQFLLMPTARITGIESPAILSPDAPNYWDAAWQARHFVDERAHRDLPRDAISLAINSAERAHAEPVAHPHRLRAPRRAGGVARRTRTRLVPAGRRFRQGSPATTTWRCASTSRTSRDSNPFILLADGIPGARADMARYTLVLVGVAEGFVLLAGHADGIANRGSGEELQDHACAAAH